MAPSLESPGERVVQLSVPVIPALGAVAFLAGRPSARLVGSGLAVVGGVALALSSRKHRRT